MLDHPAIITGLHDMQQIPLLMQAELLSDLSSGAHGVSVAAVFVTTMIMNLYLAVSMAEKMITGTIHSSRSSRSSIAKVCSSHFIV